VPACLVLLDSGAAASAWVVWVGCTQDVCQGHNLYVPSTGSSFFNFSIIDNPAFGDGSDNFTTWRVNDTVGFGSVTTTATFGAAFHLHAGGEALDGNFGQLTVSLSLLTPPVLMNRSIRRTREGILPPCSLFDRDLSKFRRGCVLQRKD
jgi:hypothetical protein